MQSVTVIGIDPGSQRTGWGVVREVSGVLQLVDCGVVLEGQLYRHIEVGEPTAADLLLIEILQISVADDLLRTDQRIHFEPLTRLGGPDYGVLGERFPISKK